MILLSSIKKLMQGEHLDGILCGQILDEILDTSHNPLQIAAFLVLLRAKKETPEELSAIVAALRSKMMVVSTVSPVLDIVGTGGDGTNTVNISTGSAILAASCKVKVAKHGNRAVSSLAGSADVLEALGVNIQMTTDRVSQCIDEVGIGFCYFPNFHPKTLPLQSLRQQLNIPTTMNLLGPLLNPAKAAHLLLGVSDPALVHIMAEVLSQLDCKRSVIVHGNGLDELSCLGSVTMIEINGRERVASKFDPLDLGFARCSIEDLRGGDARHNAQLLLDVFKGKEGPLGETLILNASVALYLYGSVSSIPEAVSQVRNHLYSGKAYALLEHWRAFSNEPYP